MQEIIVKENDAGQRLDKFMEKRFLSMPKPLLYKYLRKKCVRINGVRTDRADIRLSVGDKLSFYINDEFFSVRRSEREFLDLSPSFGVVYEDENILLAEKPVGLLCQSDEKENRNTLINHIKSYLYQKKEYDPDREETFAPALCNRIDKNTHGIVIAAKNAESLRILNEKIKNREIEKIYHCLVFGKMPKPEDKLTAYLKKDPKANHVHIIAVQDKEKKYKKIVTSYRVLRELNGVSELEVTLHTGRTHQIRAHMAFIGHPLVGDGKYGNQQSNKNTPFRYQVLSSCRLTFAFTSPAGKLEYLNHKMFFVKPDYENRIGEI